LLEIYDYEKQIGKGSQASIGLYALKGTELKYAIKSFTPEEDCDRKEATETMVQNEIRYLRDLYMCENIISLESVHLDIITK
jgi:hypothetical protein